METLLIIYFVISIWMGITAGLKVFIELGCSKKVVTILRASLGFILGAIMWPAVIYYKEIINKMK